MTLLPPEQKKKRTPTPPQSAGKAPKQPIKAKPVAQQIKQKPKPVTAKTNPAPTLKSGPQGSVSANNAGAKNVHAKAPSSAPAAGSRQDVPVASNKTSAALESHKSTGTATPAAAHGIMDFFGRELGALRKQGSAGLAQLQSSAKTIISQAKAFAKNPARAIKSGASSAITAGWNKVKGVKGFAADKIKQFKAWYATPEGKAKFWKGVALTGVGLATVATGGALTAPALALAGAISAGGGIAAQVVENKVYNAAAKLKKGDKTYRNTFKGVTLKDVATDFALGSLGGPVFKFGGKVLVGTAEAIGKGALPALKGVAQIGAGATKGVLGRLLPGSVKTALKSAGNLVKTNGAKLIGSVKRIVSGGKKVVQSASTTVKSKAVSLYQKTAGIRTKLAEETKTIRQYAKNATDAPKEVKQYLGKQVAALRKVDRKLLVAAKKQVRKSPTVKLAQAGKARVDGVGDKVSKQFVKDKVRIADGLDSVVAKSREKISESRLGKLIRQAKENTTARLDSMITQHPESHYSKAILEFRASGTAIRAHLNKVWSEAGQGLNKDLSRLLGRHGSVQADFKNLAEKGNKELYQDEVKKARELAEKRLREKVAHDVEHAELLGSQRRGIAITDEVRRRATQLGQDTADRAIQEANEQLTRQSEKFVARHPQTVLEEVALKTEALESMKKASEQYLGNNSGKKGLLERSGMALTASLRAPISERLEKYGKIVTAIRSDTPLASVTMVGTDALREQTEKAVSASLKAPFKDIADRFKGEVKPKKATEQESSQILDILEKTKEDFFPGINFDDYLKDFREKIGMKDED